MAYLSVREGIIEKDIHTIGILMAGIVNRSSVRLQFTSIGRHSPHKLLKHPRYVASRKGNLLQFFFNLTSIFFLFILKYNLYFYSKVSLCFMLSLIHSMMKGSKSDLNLLMTYFLLFFNMLARSGKDQTQIPFLLYP